MVGQGAVFGDRPPNRRARVEAKGSVPEIECRKRRRRLPPADATGSARSMTRIGTIWLLAGLLCLALWPAHGFAQGDRWEGHMAAAEAAYRQGNYAEAESRLDAAPRKRKRSGRKTRAWRQP